MIIGYIYKVTNKINNKIYVGSTINKPNYRWSNHKSLAKIGSNCKFHKAIRKYGVENFIFEVIFCTKQISKLEDIEEYFISKYESLNQLKGYNMIPVGKNRTLIQELMKKEWETNKEERIKKLIESAKPRAKPLVAVNKFNATIIEFPSINDALKKGYTWGSIRQSLIGECKHAYNYVWFYKSNNIDYVKEAEKRLGKFNNTNIKPFKAINVLTKEELIFSELKEVENFGFQIKAVRQVLTGRRKTYNNYSFIFI